MDQIQLIKGNRLRDLITAVRQTKTQAEERAVIKAEKARIRSCTSAEEKPRNMLKMMYISMLGHGTESAQVEVVNLLADPNFASKRVAYLALSTLLDENQEVLTLAENHIKKDLNDDKSQFVQALALDCVANVAGEDMARNMCLEVAGLLNSTNVHLRKKAALAALRIVRRAPESAEMFLERMLSFTSQRNHAVMLTGMSLVTECLETPYGETFIDKFRQMIPTFVNFLKGVVLSPHATDYDVSGIVDPFLQVKLLRFFGTVAYNHPPTVEAVNDILAQVATNTDSTKNAGCAILYECVRTIFRIGADDGLMTLGFNILARFLTNKDNNVRFCALTVFLHLIYNHEAEVQKHRTTVIECLRDPDVAIRRRALQLTVALVDKTNVRLLVPDLIDYLEVCTPEMHQETTEQLCEVVSTTSPNADWRVEMSLRLFSAGKKYVPEDFALQFIAVVTQQSAASQKKVCEYFWQTLNVTFNASLLACTSLILAGIWIIGEFGSTFVSGNVKLQQDAVKLIIRLTTESSYVHIKQYALNALVKLSTRFPTVKALTIPVFELIAGSMNPELQQRACEYLSLLNDFPELAQACFAPMPTINLQAVSKAQPDGVPVLGLADPQVEQQQPKLLTMEDIFKQNPDTGGGAPTKSVPVLSSIQELFDQPTKVDQNPPQVRQGVEVFKNSDVIASVQAHKVGGIKWRARIFVTNQTLSPVKNICVLIAVPKTVVLQIAPAPSQKDVQPAGAPFIQELDVETPDTKLVIKVKLAYHINGQEKTEMFTVSQEFAVLA